MTDVFSSSRRYLALWLPLLPADRLHRLRRARGEKLDERPLVILAKVKSALRIVHTDRRAREYGLTPGLTLADARARVPDLDIHDEDAAADAALLEHVADWCDRYTPLIGMDGDDGLMLDITGCAHLFGGEKNLRDDLMRRLAHFGFNIRSAIAATPDAARALACFTKGGIYAPGEQAEAVRSLPVAALGIDSETGQALARAGLKTIGAVAVRPRAPLAARFGKDLLERLLCTLGEVDHPVSPRRPMPELAAERRFPEPVLLEQQISATLEELAGELVPHLEARGAGGRKFEASFFRADGAVRRIAVLTGRPLRQPKTLTKLFAEKLDALADPLDPGFGFDLIRLSVIAAENLNPAQASLDSRSKDDEDIAELVDRLVARFGAAHVTRFVAVDTHMPERAARIVPAIAAAKHETQWSAGAANEPPLRPLSLFDPPEPVETLAEVPDGPPVRFRWRRVMRDIACAEGPERIAPEWWRGAGLTRDYFRVEDTEGRRYWLFREGLYARDNPRWFVHGLFA